MIYSSTTRKASVLGLFLGAVLGTVLCLDTVPAAAQDGAANTNGALPGATATVYGRRLAAKPRRVLYASVQSGTSVAPVALKPARSPYGLSSYVCTPSGFGHLASCSLRHD